MNIKLYRPPAVHLGSSDYLVSVTQNRVVTCTPRAGGIDEVRVARLTHRDQSPRDSTENAYDGVGSHDRER